MAGKLNIATQFLDQNYHLNKILQFTHIHKTTWYRSKNYIANTISKKPGKKIPGFSHNILGLKVIDDDIILAIKELRSNIYLSVAGGYKKLKHYLKREYGYIVNNKKLYRLCKENNLLIERRRKSKTNRRISCNRKITNAHKVWEFDIKYGYIHGQNRFFYILVYIDVFTRKIIHYHIGLQCKAKHLAATLTTALRKACIDVNHDLVIRSDNGPQMTSKMFYKYLMNDVKHKIEHEFIPCATPNKDAHVEAFYSIVESEFIAVHWFKNFKDVYRKFYEFVEFYNTFRVHGSLKGRTPEAVMMLCNSGNTPSDIKEINI